MAKSKAAATASDADDLLGGAATGGDDLLGKPAAKKAAKKTAPAKKAAAKAEAKPKKEKPAATERATGTRGEGKYFMSIEDKEALAKKIGTAKKPISTKELAEKYEAETWQVRRAINEVLVPASKGTVEKVGNTLTYTPA